MTAHACTAFEKALRHGEPSAAALGELRAHAAGCDLCAQKLALWDGIEREAPALHREWESPNLMPRFAAALEAEKAAGPAAREAAEPRGGTTRRSRAWIPVAAAAALFLVSMVGLHVFQSGFGREIHDPMSGKEVLLTDRSLDEVETAEANYVRSIEKLSQAVKSKIENPTTPLLVSYREKLLVLDSAISEMRTQIDSNRFNSHLRRELLAMYQEKQRTLQELMKEGNS